APLPKGPPQLLGGEGEQPGPVQGAPVHLSGVEDLPVLPVKGPKAIRGHIVGGAFIPEGPVLIPLDGSGGQPGVKLRPDLVSILPVEYAGTLVEALGKGALIADPAVRGILGALTLVCPAGKGPHVG